MQDEAQRRFDKLLKAMAQGEPPKGRKNTTQETPSRPEPKRQSE
jgi:hypothetical protein